MTPATEPIPGVFLVAIGGQNDRHTRPRLMKAGEPAKIWRMNYRTSGELEAGLPHLLESPRDAGTVELIVRRPDVDERELLDVGELDLEVGLVGDSWKARGSSRRPDGSANPYAQVTLMNARSAALVAGPPARWALAGDQLYVDLDLSDEHLPAGSRLAMGGAVVEVSLEPHTGCTKFAERFGPEALRFVNTGIGRELNLRGRNARVVVPGTVRRGDAVKLLPAER